MNDSKEESTVVWLRDYCYWNDPFGLKHTMFRVGSGLILLMYGSTLLLSLSALLKGML